MAYRCQTPEQSVAVELDLELIDNLCAAVMTGYGLVPKRGAEVGGLLLGKVEPDAPTVVRVLDFVPISSEYQKGPTYRLSEQDLRQFADQVQALRREPVGDLEIVGLYRSHTRDNFGATDEDLALLDEHCASPHAVFLLIRPSATRVPEATVLTRRNGRIPRSAPERLFHFRRKILETQSQPSSGTATAGMAGGLVRSQFPERDLHRAAEREKAVSLPFHEATAHEAISPEPEQRDLAVRKPRITFRNPWVHGRTTREVVPLGGQEMSVAPDTIPALEGALAYGQEVNVPFQQRGDAWQQARASSLAALDSAALARERRQKLLAGVLIAILFLIVGIIGGIEVTSHAAGPARMAKPVYYEFGLQADPQPQGVAVTWDGRAPAVRDASSGLLVILDGEAETRVPLSSAELERGSVLYRNRTHEMRFRMEVPQGQHSTLIESVELRLPGTAP